MELSGVPDMDVSEAMRSAEIRKRDIEVRFEPWEGSSDVRSR